MIKKLAWATMLLLCIVIGAYAFAFFFVETLGDPEFKARFALAPLPAWGHILGGGLCLTLGSLQFHSGLRRHQPRLHRWTGRVYLTCVLVGGFGGLLLAPDANGGPVAKVGFGMLAIVWLYSGANAYLCIRRRDIKQHQQWMIRNFSLTFAAVTLRLHLPILQGGFGLSFEEAYPIVAWLAWVPNIVVAEWLIIARSKTNQTSALLES